MILIGISGRSEREITYAARDWPAVRPQPNARAVRKAQMPAFQLLVWNLQPLTTPDTLDPLVID